MLKRVRATIESGFLSFIFFAAFVFIYRWFLEPEALITVILIVSAHYLTAIFCGYWAGWRSKTDGWLYGIIGYALFRGLAFLFHVHAVLPFPYHIKFLKLVGYIPILALLMFGAVIGEQRAHYAPISQRHKALYPVIKRILDLIGSVAIILMLAPIMLAIAFGIKFTSPGPIFFHQKRVGQHGRIINVIKFRTMSDDADELLDRLELLKDQDDQACQIKDDPRIFPFGKFLRSTSLDELPQFINIAKGEMSLVGPRPLVPEELETSDMDNLKKLEVKPGLTGLAQINGRGNLTFDERLQMDVQYVDNQSLFLDLKIVLATLWQVLARHGAY